MLLEAPMYEFRGLSHVVAEFCGAFTFLSTSTLTAAWLNVHTKHRACRERLLIQKCIQRWQGYAEEQQRCTGHVLQYDSQTLGLKSGRLCRGLPGAGGQASQSFQW